MTKIQKILAQMREVKVQLENCKPEEREAIERQYASLRKDAEIENIEAISREHTHVEKKTIVSQIREAMETPEKQFVIHAGVQKREGAIVANSHTTDVQMEGVLEPLYADSLLTNLGVRWYTGLPMGDVRVPALVKGSVAWAGETGSASASGQTFSSVTLKPKRITAYIDISKKFILQDTDGGEMAVRRDLINGINDKLEATIFGYADESVNQPKGLFFNETLADARDFSKVCNIEATLDDANIRNLKYVLSSKARADLRSMAKSNKLTQLVLEGGNVDGIPAFVSSNVKDSAASAKGAYIVGDWSNLAIGSWGDIDITVDPYTKAGDGCIRLVVNAYFDAQICRDEAFAFGDTRFVAAG